MRKPPLLKRIAAFCIDCFIARFALIPFDYYFASKDLSIISRETILVGALFYIVFMAYFVLYEYILKTTPGKALFGLEVTGVTTITKAIIRNIQTVLIIPVWILDIPWALSKSRNRLLERLSKTAVVSKTFLRSIDTKQA